MVSLEPATLTARAEGFTFRPYQVSGTLFLKDAKYAILSDPPGAGKTLQAAEAAEGPTLVTCPAYLALQWYKFLKSAYPNDRVCLAAVGNPTMRYLMMMMPGQDWYIVAHDMFTHYSIEDFPAVKTVIADEFHHFRGKDAKRSKNFARYVRTRGIERVYGLTATPIYRDIGDLYQQFHILYPEKYRSYWGFIQRWAVTSDYGFGTKIIRPRNKAALDREMSSFVLQRTYGQIGLYLPKLIPEVISLQFSEKERKVYNTLRDYYRLELEGQDAERFYNAGAVVHELRKLTLTQEKLKTIKEIVQDNPTGHPPVIFAHYIPSAQAVAEYLGVRPITGAMAPTDRHNLARASLTNKTPVVCTIDSLSEGIDLSDSRLVIFVEEDYLPGKMYQALSRVQRHREEHAPVICKYLRYEKTVDESVAKVAKVRSGNALDVLREALAAD